MLDSIRRVETPEGVELTLPVAGNITIGFRGLLQ